ncbi:MAG TPA: toll/interleukin-1 receptor domain-containing protein [Ktedonobacterales bacterium]|jgi:tetratricopeptide (TPR) repeat protein
MSQMRVFVSHSHEDTAFCHALVQALRGAGADVWYDEHNMGSGRLGPTIEREVRERPVFVVILSPAALHSPWVEDETGWAYGLLRKEANRLILPVTAAALQENDIWLFLRDFKRIEAPGMQTLPLEEAVRRTLHTLALTPAGTEPTLKTPQPTESPEDLLARGKALQAQGKHAEALPFFERATELAPQSFDAWVNVGSSRHLVNRPQQEQLDAFERATSLNPSNAIAWNGKSLALVAVKRYSEALAAVDQALALDPQVANFWDTKGEALNRLQRYDEALRCLDRALALNPGLGEAWKNKAVALRGLGRTAEAEAAERRVKELEGE